MTKTGSVATRASSSRRALSLVHGPRSPGLWNKTIGALVEEQADVHGDRDALVVSWQSARLTYQDLAERTGIVAKAMLDMGLRHGQCVGIMAGNCQQYVEAFLGAARIGCPVVVLNNTYSPSELKSAVQRSECELLFISNEIGSRKLSDHIDYVLDAPSEDSLLRHIVFLSRAPISNGTIECESYHTFLNRGLSIFMNTAVLKRAERRVKPTDVLNLQFTSGTTGIPKAAVLTHLNLINNARFVGHAMELTPQDVVCCPPPLFHCFGLVMGFLASFCHGSSLVFPSDNFNAARTLDAVVREKATALLGVPTMFYAELEAMEKSLQRVSTVRTGLVAGAPVPPSLMESLKHKMNVQGLLIAYGMTETSPVTFITSLNDPDEKKLSSLGRVLPHTGAKVIDLEGRVVPRGERGELCTSGFALQKGYWKDENRTREVMRPDEHGVVWMHTGDEGFIDDDGYGHITGRIKDLIIRGGENISPNDIEDRLLRHPSVSECCVVGIEDNRYGEVVGAFLKAAEGESIIPDDEVRDWVMEQLGRHKAPVYIFWLDDPGVGSELPKTGSGKYQKHLVRAKGNALVKRASPKAKL